MKYFALLALCLSALMAQESGKLGVRIKTTEKKGEKPVVIISDLVVDGAASKAGLAEGDVIVSINGKVVTDTANVKQILRNTKPGDRVEVIVNRDNGEGVYVVDLMGGNDFKFDPDFDFKTNNKFFYVFGDTPWLGVSLHQLTGQLAKHFNVDGGVMVDEVHLDSPADKAGLKAGDIIVGLAGQNITNSHEIHKAIREFEAGDVVEVEIMRNGNLEILRATLEKRENQPHVEFFGGDANVQFGDIPFGKRTFEIHRSDDLEKEVEALRKELEQLKKELKDN